MHYLPSWCYGVLLLRFQCCLAVVGLTIAFVVTAFPFPWLWIISGIYYIYVFFFVLTTAFIIAGINKICMEYSSAFFFLIVILLIQFSIRISCCISNGYPAVVYCLFRCIIYFTNTFNPHVGFWSYFKVGLMTCIYISISFKALFFKILLTHVMQNPLGYCSGDWWWWYDLLKVHLPVEILEFFWNKDG